MNKTRIEQARRIGQPPESYINVDEHIGETEIRRGLIKLAGIPRNVRDRHVYIVGKSGSGKSTLLSNAAIANIRRGEGVCVIDPHGDLVANGDHPLLDYIPRDRIKDTIYFDASEKEHPVALNMLQAESIEEASLLADNLLVTFRRLSDGWGPRMDDILRATLQTLIHVKGSTFLDIKRLLQQPEFRASVARKLHHPMLEEFWEQDFPNYGKDASTPIISRINKFLFLPQLYKSLSSPKSNLNFYDVIQNRKVLLVNLASGSIGEDNAQLLGSLIVTQLQMAIMRRATLPPDARIPYFLYVDEFQNFTTSSFEKILSEARKYKLCLTLAHQFINQLGDSQRDAIFGNVGTMIMFTCGDKDAHALRYQLGSFEPQDLVNLKKYHAILRPESAAETFSLATLPPPEKPVGYAREIIEYTKSRYAVADDERAESIPQTRIEIISKPQVGRTPEPWVEREKPRESPRELPITLQEASSKIQAPSFPKPMPALEKSFAGTSDKILYYIGLAGYLSTQQIIALCFSHQGEASRKANASKILTKLVAEKRLKSQPFGSGKIYTTERMINPTNHNLSVRDLFVRIALSDYEIGSVNFTPNLGTFAPDLAMNFVSEDGELIRTFWEYDAGTEGMEVLKKKVERYSPYVKDYLITFVFDSEARMEKAGRGARGVGWMRLAVLDQIETLGSEVFRVMGSDDKVRFFS